MNSKCESVFYLGSSIGFPGLIRATVEVATLKGKTKTNLVAGTILVFLKSAFPEKLGNQHLQYPVLDCFWSIPELGIIINDAYDVADYARANGKKEAASDIYREWRNTLREIDTSAGSNEFINQLINSYQREIVHIERTAKDPKIVWNLGKAKRYREITNAISVVTIASILLGEENAPTPRLKQIAHSDLSWDSINQKYSWIIEGEPQSPTEQKLCALFNLVMAFQVWDDWDDLEYDNKLGLHTVATEIIKSGVSFKKSKKLMAKAADYYFQKSQEFGVSETANIVFKFLFGATKSLRKTFPQRFGGLRERILTR